MMIFRTTRCLARTPFLSSLLLCTSTILAFNTVPLPTKTWDFSAYPISDQSAPVKVNPTFAQKYDISGISGAPKTPTPQSTQPSCAVLQGKPATCDWSCNNCLKPEDVTACGKPNSWGLTFDDGPSPYTPTLLDFLAAKNLKATFCVIGSNVMKYPNILLRAYLEGHHICIHSWSHWSMTTLPNDVLLAEFEWTRMIVEQVIGASPIYWRPPYGDVDDRVRAVATAAGMKHNVLWNVDSNDWKLQANPNGVDITAGFSAAALKIGPTGVISLQHDLYNATIQKGISAINGLLQLGNINLMSMAECKNDLSPYSGNPILPPRPGPSPGSSSAGALPSGSPSVTGPSSASNSNSSKNAAISQTGSHTGFFAAGLVSLLFINI